MAKLDSKIPKGPIDKKWTNHKSNIKLVNPANKRAISVIVIGSGLAGASAAATMGEAGYDVKCFCFQDLKLSFLYLRNCPYWLLGQHLA